MLDFLTRNWVLILLLAAMAWMHFGGHRGHGGQGGHVGGCGGSRHRNQSAGASTDTHGMPNAAADLGESAISHPAPRRSPKTDQPRDGQTPVWGTPPGIEEQPAQVGHAPAQRQSVQRHHRGC